MEKLAYIIGNGPSREQFDIAKLKGTGVIYGCNALYRDYSDLIDFLVAIDPPIIDEITKSNFPKDKFIVPPHDEQF